LRLELWSLTPLSTIFQLYRGGKYINNYLLSLIDKYKNQDNESFSPCLTPVKRWERSENRFWLQAQDFIFRV
jgi:hypothetical protein